MYKVTIQNVNQVYFSLQDHKGKRISLSRLDMRVFRGLTLQEANSYKKYIPLGLCVLIQEDNNFVEASFEVVDDVKEAIEEKDEVIEDAKEVEVIIDEQVEEDKATKLSRLRKDELRELCDKEGLSWKGKLKAELVEMLVEHYGL